MLLTNTTYRLEYGNPYIKTRTEDGWTADIVFNRDNIPFSGGSVFYYWGISGETIESNYADNNLSFGFTEDGRIIWKSIRYTPVDTINGTTNLYTLTSGATPTLCDDGTSQDFNITITFKRYKTLTDCDLENKGGLNDLIGSVTNTTSYKDWVTGATENKVGVEILNKKWFSERNSRLGTLKIYLNGNQIYKLENFEEIIPSQRESENQLIQSWGAGSDGMGGVHSGFCQFIIQNVEYYEVPFNFIEVKNHYKNSIEPNFNIIECNYPCGLGPTPSPSVTPTMTPTPSIRPTSTPTPTIASTSTPTPSVTPTLTPTASVTPTHTHTPTTTPSMTPDPTRTPMGTPDPSPSNPMTRTPTPTPTMTPTTSGAPGFATGPFTFDFDYMVVEYFFSDGADMDTMAYLSNPSIMNNDFTNGLPGDYVGTCAESNNGPQFPNDGVNNPYLIYGGDNLGTGTEAVLFDLVEFKNQRPSDHNIELTFTSTWYGTPGANPVIMRSTMWKGGSPVQDGFTFVNPSATSTQMVESDGTIITSNLQTCEAFEEVSKFVFNTQTYSGYFINPGQTGVTPTPTASVTSTPSHTPAVTQTMTPTNSQTHTLTPTNTPTNTTTPTSTIQPTQTPTNTVTPTASPCVTGATFVTTTDTMWLYPQADIDYVLTNTSVPVTFVANKFYFNNRTDMKTLYEELVARTEVTQPIGNTGYSLGVGTELLDLINELYFVLIDTNEIVVTWRLTRQLTDQTTLPVGGNSPIDTIGYLTTSENWPVDNRPVFYDPAYSVVGDNICIPPFATPTPTPTTTPTETPLSGAILIENGNILSGENGNGLLLDNSSPTPTPTNSPTKTLTATPTLTPTNTTTNTPTPSVSPDVTQTSTPTQTPTNTVSITPTLTQTPAVTSSPTNTLTPTPTPTHVLSSKSWLINTCGDDCTTGVCTCNNPSTTTVYTIPSVSNLTVTGVTVYSDSLLTTTWNGYYYDESDQIWLFTNGVTSFSHMCQVGIDPCIQVPSNTVTPTPTVTTTMTPTPTSPMVVTGNWYLSGNEGLFSGPGSGATLNGDGNMYFSHGLSNDPLAWTITYNPNFIDYTSVIRINTKNLAGVDYLSLFQSIRDNGGTISLTQNGKTASFVFNPGLILISNQNTYFLFTFGNESFGSVTQTQQSPTPFNNSDPITITFRG